MPHLRKKERSFEWRKGRKEEKRKKEQKKEGKKDIYIYREREKVMSMSVRITQNK